MSDHDTHDDFDETGDIPLDRDDFLIQRYLDGSLDEEEALQVEFRIDEDDAFASRMQAYESMFSALDRSAVARAAVMWGDHSMPAAIVDAALNRWQPDAIETPSEPAVADGPSGLEQIFGGIRPAAAAFIAADIALAALIVALAVVRGPVEMLKSVVLGLKDVTLFTLSHSPGGDQLAWLVPVTALIALGGLYVVRAGMRGLVARTGGVA